MKRTTTDEAEELLRSREAQEILRKEVEEILRVEADEILRRFNPSAEALFEILRPDDPILQVIAKAHYSDRDLALLRHIRDDARATNTKRDAPWEAVLLTRWIDPDNPEQNPAATAKEGHIARAFACAILLCAQPEECANETVAQLLASARALGRAELEATGQLFAWLMPQARDHLEYPFLAFALLIVAGLLGPEKVTEAELERLADWAVTEESHVRKFWFWGGVGLRPVWLLGLTHSGLCFEVWRSLARSLLEVAAGMQSDTARGKVADLAARVLMEDPQDGDIPDYALECLSLLDRELGADELSFLLPIVVLSSPRNNLSLAATPAWKKEAWKWLQAEAHRFEPLTDHPDEEVAELARWILSELEGRK
ncbi:MAG TPA: hypothetical protein VJ810_21800 [Blastocatellia bacterium]|nr:hypothetical protein [Blastocatellia bacterium]